MLKPLARTTEIVVLEVENETLVYDLRSSEAHCLNETAAFIWRHCDGSNTAAEITSLVEREYDSPVNDDFVLLAFGQLEERALFENAPAYLDARPNRREMIKRVAKTCIVATPIIASIVAPQSVFAQTSCACVNPGACITQTLCPSQNNCNGNGVCAP